MLRVPPFAVVYGLVAAIGVVDHFTGPQLLMIFFYVVPIVLGAAWFGTRSGFVVALSCSLAHTVADYIGQTEPYTWVTLWNRVFVLAIYVGVAQCIAELVALQRRLEERVQARTRELEKAMAARTELQNKIGAASRYERNAIGRELHDGLCQHLAAANIAAGMLARKLDAAQPDASAGAHAISGMLAGAIGQTRRIARGLLLEAVTPGELGGELRELCRNASGKHGVECVFSGADTALEIDDEQASHLFFVAQEALRNALRHAGASRIEIALRDAAGTLELTVSDNGRGFGAAAAAGAAEAKGAAETVNAADAAGMANAAGATETAGATKTEGATEAVDAMEGESATEAVDVMEVEGAAETAGAEAGGEREGRARLGVMIMRHRAGLIGAHFEIGPAADGRGGTRVRCRLPRTANRAKNNAA
jgi:signal transduction histidine kinase